MTSTMAVASSSSSSRTGSDCSLYMPRKPSTTRPFPSSGFTSSAPVLPLRSLSASPRYARFSDSRRPASPRGSISAKTTTTTTQQSDRNASAKRTCLCSRSTHSGSFRCSLHKTQPRGGGGGGGVGGCDRAASSQSSSSSSRLNLRRLAMANSLLRIGAEGDLVRRVMSSLARPSMSEQRRREAFRPRPSRLSAVSGAEDS